MTTFSSIFNAFAYFMTALTITCILYWGYATYHIRQREHDSFTWSKHWSRWHMTIPFVIAVISWIGAWLFIGISFGCTFSGSLNDLADACHDLVAYNHAVSVNGFWISSARYAGKISTVLSTFALVYYTLHKLMTISDPTSSSTPKKG